MSTTVETKYGALQGVEEDGLVVFKGVRYAAPPEGRLRFRPPQPPEPWSGVHVAAEFAPMAPQVGGILAMYDGGHPQSEDCLFLNVWTPGLDPAARRPVMVWIHGGSLTSGAGSSILYRGNRLSKSGDVVVVTINYRLGALGWLAHPDLRDEETGAAGNWGLLDQIAALQWVQDNIEGFGGDPGNVTVFGESAGSWSVSALLGTPAAAGLFQKAIAQSGGPLSIPMERAVKTTETFLANVGRSPTDISALRELPVDEVLVAQGQLGGSPGMARALLPVVDGGVLPRPPVETIAGEHSADVAVIAGTNAEEMRLFALGDRSASSMPEERLRKRLLAAGTDESVVDGLIAAYRQAREGRGQSATPFEIWDAIETDRIFRLPTLRMLEAQAAHQPATYSYLFNYRSPAAGGFLGACHAMEIPFVFGTLTDPPIDRFTGTGAGPEGLSRRMMEAWLSFAHGGDPSTDELPWPTFDAERRATMVFDEQSRVEDAPLDDERRAWHSS
jgi:para-nitrobenzyl esterase